MSETRLAELLIGDVDRRSLREKLEGLEEGDSVRLVTDSRDVLARVEEDTQVRGEVDFTARVVETPVTIYADTPSGHQHTIISWWEPGPVILTDEEEHVKRLEVK
jgi:hypothetical protein